MAMTETQDVGTAPELKGKARVRALLIDPLIDAGLERHAKMTGPKHAAMLDRLAVRFTYMQDAALERLQCQIKTNAIGYLKNVWPAEVSIENWGRGIQKPPPRKDDYALSIMRSEMGRRAHALGYATELFIHARKVGPPPSKYELTVLMRQAEDNRRELARVNGRLERSVASADERRWLDWYLQNEAEALSVLQDRGAE